MHSTPEALKALIVAQHEECLRVSWFTNLFDARRKISTWKAEYNEQRPHSSLGYKTPAEFARVAITQSYGKEEKT
jgi:transposase InsO family protein